MLTVDGAAERLSISPRTLRREIAAGRLAIIRIGRLVRIDPADVQAYIIRNRSMEQGGAWQSANVVELGKYVCKSAERKLDALLAPAPRKRTRKSLKAASGAMLSQVG